MVTYSSVTANLSTNLRVNQLSTGVYHLELNVSFGLHGHHVTLARSALYNTTSNNHVLLIPPGRVINLPSSEILVTATREELWNALLGDHQHDLEEAGWDSLFANTEEEERDLSDIAPEPVPSPPPAEPALRQDASQSHEES